MRRWALMLLLVLTTACSSAAPRPEASGHCDPLPLHHPEGEERAKRIAEQVAGIDEAVAVMLDQELDVGLKVTNFNRLRLKQLRKEVFRQLKQKFPEEKIHVSTDSKVYRELKDLHTSLHGQNIHPCAAKRQLKHIEESMKG